MSSTEPEQDREGQLDTATRPLPDQEESVPPDAPERDVSEPAVDRDSPGSSSAAESDPSDLSEPSEGSEPSDHARGEEGGPDSSESGEDTDGEDTAESTFGDATDSNEGVETGPPAELDRGAIEAILLVTDDPLRTNTLAEVLEQPVDRVEAALHELAAEYTGQQRGFELREVAGGWRFYTREDYATVVEKFVLDGQQSKLTQAALETLAVVAYRQPVSRARVSAVRGVNCDGVMKTLVSRGLVTENGTDHESGATLFVTTAYFLERLGLGSLEELPDLAPYLPEIDEMEELAASMGGSSSAATTHSSAPSTASSEQEASSTSGEQSPPGNSDQGSDNTRVEGDRESGARDDPDGTDDPANTVEGDSPDVLTVDVDGAGGEDDETLDEAAAVTTTDTGAGDADRPQGEV